VTTTTVAEQFVFDSDHYLDCRQPGWQIYEDRGLVYVKRQPGSKTPMVFVDDQCGEVLEALQAGVPPWTRAK
jgi:hypothetical protein